MKKSDIKPAKQKDGSYQMPQVIPSTWAFKIKQYPSGLMSKIKARFCARGDLQTDLNDAFDTFAPVASWTSIRMLTIMSLQKNWKTKQIDFSNAFVHAPIDRDVYVALPIMFQDSSGTESKELCLKLKKSLYGLKDAPKLWSDYLAKALIANGMKPSAHDPAVYLGHGMAIAVYVDDLLFFGPDEGKMEELIENFQTDGFELKREKGGDDPAYDFLGIHVQELGNKVKLTQFGLIKKFLATVGMESCHAKATPCSKNPLGTDKDGPIHNEK